MEGMTRWTAVALAFLLAGCIQHRSGVIEDDFLLHKGVTTRKEVVEHWGNPDNVRGSEWTWKSSRLLGSKFKAAYMMIGVTLSNSGRSVNEWRLVFDDRGILSKAEFSESIPGGVAWQPFPF